MIKKTKLKGFTLFEMLIVLIIVGILAVVLTESYIAISRTALRIEQEKNLSEESLILTQVFQAISDEATIDYEKYGELIKNENGYVDKLYLTGGRWKGTKIYTEPEDGCLKLEGDFFDENGNIIVDEDGNFPDIKEFTNCKLILEDKDGNKTILNTSGKVVVSKVRFRIIPYDTDENYFSNNEDDYIAINDVHQPAFWMFIHLYSPLYQPIGTNKVDLPLQLFFNLNL